MLDYISIVQPVMNLNGMEWLFKKDRRSCSTFLVSRKRSVSLTVYTAEIVSVCATWIFFSVLLVTESVQSLPQQKCKPVRVSQIDWIEVKLITQMLSRCKCSERARWAEVGMKLHFIRAPHHHHLPPPQQLFLSFLSSNFLFYLKASTIHSFKAVKERALITSADS